MLAKFEQLRWRAEIRHIEAFEYLRRLVRGISQCSHVLHTVMMGPASDETTEALPFSLLPAETPPTTLSVDDCPVVVTLAVVGGVLLVDTTADEPADAMVAVAAAGGAVVGVDVLWGARCRRPCSARPSPRRRRWPRRCWELHPWRLRRGE